MALMRNELLKETGYLKNLVNTSVRTTQSAHPVAVSFLRNLNFRSA